MALSTKGKILYSATFLLLVPLALTAWAAATERIVHLPPVDSMPLGLVISLSGVILLLWGMRDLWVHGGGLPMNADPPPQYVDRGIYRFLPHPIYTGFCMLSVGLSCIFASASGLWLISPLAILGCAALILGYEDQDLCERFSLGPRKVLRKNSPSSPTIHNRFAFYLYVLLPWLALSSIVQFLWQPVYWTSLSIFMGKGVLLMRWAIGLCYSAYVGFAIVPLLARTQEALRRAAILSLLTLEFAFMMFLVIPLLLTPHLPAAHKDLWMWTGPSRESKGGWEYFPSFPAMFALLFSDVLKLRWSQLRWLAYGWVVVVAIGSAIVAQDGRSACSER